MDFTGRILEVFRSKYGTLLEEIETGVFNYIEEIILSKDLAFDAELDYGDATTAHNLKDLVESIGDGLIALKFPNSAVQSQFLEKFRIFSGNTGNRTIIDWFGNSFQPTIQRLIFHELLKYFASLTSAVQSLIENQLISPDLAKELMDIRKSELKLVLYVEWFFQVLTILESKLVLADSEYATMVKFKDPEKDLQSLYLVYRLVEKLGLSDAVEMGPVGTYLQENIEQWAPQNPNINEKYPLTLFCGVHLAKSRYINLDKDKIKGILKKLLVKVVNNFPSPAFDDTFLVYYVLRSCELLDLKLTQKLIHGLTRFEESAISEENFAKFSLSRLSTIYDIYERLNILQNLPEQFHTIVNNIIIGRTRDSQYYNFDIDFIPSPEAIFGAFHILDNRNQLDKFLFRENIQFIVRSLKDNLSLFDFGLTGQLSDVHYSIRFIEKIHDLPNDQVNAILSEYIFDEKIVGGQIPKEVPPPNFTPAAPIVSSEVSPGPSKPKIIIESSENFSSEMDRAAPSRPVPAHFGLFFGDFPVLHPDIADELELDLAIITEQRPAIFATLTTMYQWVTCMKILNLDFNLSKEDAFAKTASYRKEFGFGIPESDFPDPLHTFYGLCIYAEMDMLELIDLHKIYEYLQAEVDNMSEKFVLTNDYLFLSLRLLEQHNFPMPDYTYLIRGLLSFDVHAQTEQVNGLTDMIHFINSIKMIDPTYDISMLNDEYLTEVQIAIEEDGTINRRVSDTSKVLITLRELGLHGVAEAKFMIKYLQYDANYFIDLVREHPIGWEKDNLGYMVELGLLYWTLIGMTVIFPSIPPLNRNILCPTCKKFFNAKPKFCNECGYRF